MDNELCSSFAQSIGEEDLNDTQQSHSLERKHSIMLDLLELNFGRYNGGQTAPIGSYLNPRTLAIVQQTSDGMLPLDGTFCRVGPLGTETFATLATTLNTLLGTTYTASSFHVQGTGDVATNPGSASDDA